MSAWRFLSIPQVFIGVLRFGMNGCWIFLSFPFLFFTSFFRRAFLTLVVFVGLVYFVASVLSSCLIPLSFLWSLSSAPWLLITWPDWGCMGEGISSDDEEVLLRVYRYLCGTRSPWEPRVSRTWNLDTIDDRGRCGLFYLSNSQKARWRSSFFIIFTFSSQAM